MSMADNIPKPGDVLVYTRTVCTVGDLVYVKGERLEIMEATNKSPHGFKSGICNFLVRCKYHPAGSIWSSIWFAMDEGWLVKEENYKP